MKTLYDLLGALPDDDAEELRSAFRKAVKSTHPDINPGDPDAALRFREIVRANDILSDHEQRAAYDHLLVLARQEQEQDSKRASAVKVQTFASGVMAIAGAAATTIAGYLLFMHMSAASVAPLQPSVVVSDSIRIIPASVKPLASAAIAADTAAASAADATEVETVASLPEKAGPPGAADTAEAGAPPMNDAKFYHDRGMASYRKGDLAAALADLDLAIQIDPKFPEAYLDRGLVLYQQHKFDRAFADVASAKRVEKTNRALMNAMARKQPLRPLKLDPPKLTRVSQRRTSLTD